jgi:YggT family protein
MALISKVATLLANVVNLYSMLLFLRILLTWIPNLNWYTQPLATLSQLTEPALSFARRFIPPVGMFDFSPIVVFLLLNILQSLLRTI